MSTLTQVFGSPLLLAPAQRHTKGQGKDAPDRLAHGG